MPQKGNNVLHIYKYIARHNTEYVEHKGTFQSLKENLILQEREKQDIFKVDKNLAKSDNCSDTKNCIHQEPSSSPNLKTY